jgi:hypothetical protein
LLSTSATRAVKAAPVADPASLATLAADLKTVWTSNSTEAQLKRRIVRTVIHEVIADVDSEAAADSSGRPLDRRRSQRDTPAPTAARAAQQHLSRCDCCVRQLVLIANDDLIAGILNRNGLVTGYGNCWTRERQG